MPFVAMTLYLLPFVLWFYPDGSAICRFRDLPHPRFAASAVCPASGAVRVSGGFWCVLGGVWREAPARNAVRSGTPVGARATIRASGRRARGRASGWRLPGFWCGPGFWWLLARSGRLLARSAGADRVCGRERPVVRAPPYAPADGARAVGLLGWFWRAAGFWWLLARSGRLLARSAGAECGAVWYAGRCARHHTRQRTARAR